MNQVFPVPAAWCPSTCRMPRDLAEPWRGFLEIIQEVQQRREPTVDDEGS